MNKTTTLLAQKRKRDEQTQTEDWIGDTQDCLGAAADTLCSHCFPDPPTLSCQMYSELLIITIFKKSLSLYRHHPGKEKIFLLNGIFLVNDIKV